MAYRFCCDHCSKSFQLETPEAKECPFCFWSSSVKREDIAEAEKKQAAPSARAPGNSPDVKGFLSGAVFVLKVIFFLALLAGVGFLGYRFYSQWAAGGKGFGGAVSIDFKDPKGSEASKGNASGALAGFSSAEKEVLSREMTLPEKVEPGPGEKQILERTVEIKTGWAEKLPSALWTLAQYQQMIEEQQKFYRIPFARSYKKKLEELFTKQYLPAGDAFAKGDLLQARNLFVGSLAFPIYSKDIMKQRAVALTMLKPFINDTLAKIAALNQNLVTREKRLKEQAVTAAYQGLNSLIIQKNWSESIRAIDQLGPIIDQLDAAAKQQAVPPPYPPSIAMVDQDIQRPLAGLLAPNPVSVVNLLRLRQDLAEKRDVLAGLSPEQVKASLEAYRGAMAMIREERWQDAMNALGAVQSPEVLRTDAQAKREILQKRLASPVEEGRP